MSADAQTQPGPPSLLEQIVESLRWLPTAGPRVDPLAPTREGAAPDVTTRVEHAFDQATFCADGGPFVQLRGEQARREAQQGGRPNGALSSMLVGIKDIVSVAGLTRTWGSPARFDATPEADDAWITSALRRNGAIVIGSTAMHELAFGATGVNLHFGSPKNPYDSERISGGSSSGSAVSVANGSVDLAVGTDTGGSIRVPSALCGIVGLKPAFDTFATDGTMALSPTLDHIGLHTRTVADMTMAYEALAQTAVQRLPLKKVGVARSQLQSADATVSRAVNAALDAIAASGVELIDVEYPDVNVVFLATTTIMSAEAFAVHRELAETRGDQLGADVVDRLRLGSQLSAHSYVAALAWRTRIIEEMQKLFGGFDALVGPTSAIVAPTFAELAENPGLGAELVKFTRLGNLTGMATLTLPAPSDGLPVGVQVVAGTNELLLSAALQIESCLSA